MKTTREQNNVDAERMIVKLLGAVLRGEGWRQTERADSRASAVCLFSLPVTQVPSGANRSAKARMFFSGRNGPECRYFQPRESLVCSAAEETRTEGILADSQDLEGKRKNTRRVHSRRFVRLKPPKTTWFCCSLKINSQMHRSVFLYFSWAETQEEVLSGFLCCISTNMRTNKRHNF